MKTEEFVARYSVSKRELAGPCHGIVLHKCRTPGNRWFGAVVVDGVTELVPFHGQFSCDHFVNVFADECYRMAMAGAFKVAA